MLESYKILDYYYFSGVKLDEFTYQRLDSLVNSKNFMNALNINTQ